MKLRAWTGWMMTFAALVGTLGCGKSGPDAVIPDQAKVQKFADVKKVEGTAAFGNYCSLGSYVAPQPVPIILVDCPMNIDTLKLSESLRSFDFQADCKKKTLDVRSPTHAFEPITWEVMPDGNFYFSMDGGTAKIKDDGAGHHDCTVPLRADMWGKIECQNPDKPIIRVETVWWLGKTLDPSAAPIGVPSASAPGGSSSAPYPTGGNPHPSASPNPTPNPQSTSSPSTPAAHPSSAPSPTSSPTATPTHRLPWLSASYDSQLSGPRMAASPSPTPSASTTPSSRPYSYQGTCKLPEPSTPDSLGCYFHNITRINQCSY